MMKRFTLMIFAILAYSSIALAQELIFVQNGNTIQDGATIYCNDIDILGTMDPHIFVKNTTTGDIDNASLTISHKAEPLENGFLGYCGWGTTSCMPVSYDSPLTRTTTVKAGESVNPSVDVMNADPDEPVFVHAEYKLSYNGKTQVIYVIFTLDTSAMQDTQQYRSNAFVYRDGNINVLSYTFDRDAKRVLRIYNVIGNKVFEAVLENNTGIKTLPEAPNGMYIYTITENNRAVKSGKYIVK